MLHTAPVDVLCGQNVLYLCLLNVLISQHIFKTRGWPDIEISIHVANIVFGAAYWY